MPINMQELKFRVLEYIKLRGPVIPVQISKQIGSNILFAGALLSELSSNGKVKISNAKIGGSPVYYLPGQEPRLNILYGYLHEREKHAYNLLKEKKVLLDKELQPVERVALREIKDFAYPIQTSDEIFWKWHLLSQEDAMVLINQLLDQKKPIQSVTHGDQPLIYKGEVEVKQDVEEEGIKEKTTSGEKADIKKDVIKKLETKKKFKDEEESFIKNLKNYINNKKIKIIEESVVKKGKEFDYIVEIPSQIGNVRFLLSARNKKKINDAELSLIHNKSQLKKLPLLILSNGELTKQAKDYINSNYLIFEKL